MTTSENTQDVPSTADRQKVRTAAAILGQAWLDTLTMSTGDSPAVNAGYYLARRLDLAGLIIPEE